MEDPDIKIVLNELDFSLFQLSLQAIQNKIQLFIVNNPLHKEEVSELIKKINQLQRSFSNVKSKDEMTFEGFKRHFPEFVVYIREAAAFLRLGFEKDNPSLNGFELSKSDDIGLFIKKMNEKILNLKMRNHLKLP